MGVDGWELVSANYVAGPPEIVPMPGGRSMERPGGPMWIGVMKRPR
jgi:hypothetical protein